MKPLRIAHVTATFPPLRTGTGNVCYHNARQLVERGHKVTVFTPNGDGAAARESLDGTEVCRLRPLARYGNAILLPSLVSLLCGFDLVHLHMPFYGAAGAVYLFHKLTRTPLLITHHQDVLLRGPTQLISRALDRLIGRRLMCSAGRTCFTSLDYAHHSKYAQLIASKRLKPVELPNGVDPTNFSPGLPPPRLVNDIALEGQRVALFVGALDRAHYFKGLAVLLQAMSHPSLTDLGLVIVGSGDLRPGYGRRVSQLNLDRRVHFAGFVPDSQLPDYYHLADVTVLPSTTAGEAFGLVLLESLACATPVVASNLPGVRTIVKPGDDGLLADPADVNDLTAKLASLLARPQQERQAMGLAGRRKVEARYAWPQIGDLLEELYVGVFAQLQHETGPRAKTESGW